MFFVFLENDKKKGLRFPEPYKLYLSFLATQIYTIP